MTITLAFDVYGTLIDTHGVVAMLEDMIGERAKAFSQNWRDKQLEYSFRRGLMQHYQNFAVCTRDALDFTNDSFGSKLSNNQKIELLNSYKTLPAFADVKTSLEQLNSLNYQLHAFSNGSAQAVNELLVCAGIRDHFIDVVSTDEIQSFKPNPAVFQHFLDRSGSTKQHSWLISSNPFDVIGAISSGLRAAWVKRSSESIYDPWGIEPTITISSLLELIESLQIR